jgi:outer membrane protein OmpA-like peptidoglycan-associated protein
MKAFALAFALLAAPQAPCREAGDLVLGDNAVDCDVCARPTRTPTPRPTPSPTPPPPTPAPSPMPSPAATPLPAIPMAWESHSVLLVTLSEEAMRFDYGKATLGPAALRQIDRLARFAQSHPVTAIGVDGHTDANGNDGFNRRLSLARAQQVRNQLVLRGVPARAFTAVRGWAADKPLDKSDTQAGDAKNRRVEVRFRMGQ